MKMKVVLFIGVLGISCAQAQTQQPYSGQNQQTAPGYTAPAQGYGAPRPDYNYQAQGYTNNTTALGASNLNFTNQTGQVFSVGQLASQLQNLRAAIYQTMPALTAFNKQYGSSAAGSQSLASRLSSIVSGSSPTPANGQNASELTKVEDALRNLLSKNNNGATPVTANMITDLQTLQRDLQPVPALLQDLNIGSNFSAAPSQVISSTPTNLFNRSYTPTGR